MNILSVRDLEDLGFIYEERYESYVYDGNLEIIGDFRPDVNIRIQNGSLWVDGSILVKNLQATAVICSGNISCYNLIASHRVVCSNKLYASQTILSQKVLNVYGDLEASRIITRKLFVNGTTEALAIFASRLHLNNNINCSSIHHIYI